MVSLAFSDAGLAKLAKHGVQISTARHPEVGYGQTRFEPPCVIDAQIFFDTVVEVGAFSAAYGGRLRHCRIGRYCSIAPAVQFGWDAHPVSFITSSMAAYVDNIHQWRDFVAPNRPLTEERLPAFKSIRKITEIGHDVWIGHGAFIMAGVTIGTGAIVGASSVVTKDIPPYSVWAGNPARLIKMRFPEDLIEKLLASEWWRYSIFDLHVPLLSKPEELLDWLSKSTTDFSIKPYSPMFISENEIESILND